jgi:arsenate reductase (thioredoxin)
MAAATFNQLADPAKAQALSAGTQPGARVHPEVVAAMQEVGIDLATAVPRRLTDDLARHADILVTMGCGDACPVLPGVERDGWPIEDPGGKPIVHVRKIREDVERRVRRLLAERSWGRDE